MSKQEFEGGGRRPSPAGAKIYGLGTVDAAKHFVASSDFSSFSLDRCSSLALPSARFSLAHRLSPLLKQLEGDSLLFRGFGNLLLAIESRYRPQLYSVGQAWNARFNSTTGRVSFSSAIEGFEGVAARTEFPAKLIGVENKQPGYRPAVELVDPELLRWKTLSAENKDFNTNLLAALKGSAASWLISPMTTYPTVDFDPLWHWTATVGMAAGSEAVPFVVGHWKSGKRQALLVDMKSGLSAVQRPSTETALDFFQSDVLSSWDACFNGRGKCRIPQPGRTLAALAGVFGLNSRYFTTESGHDAGKVVVWDGTSGGVHDRRFRGLPSGLVIQLEKVRQRGLGFPSSLPRMEDPKDLMGEILELLTGQSEITPQMISELRRKANSGSFKCSAQHFKHLDSIEAAEVRAVISSNTSE